MFLAEGSAKLFTCYFTNKGIDRANVLHLRSCPSTSIILRRRTSSSILHLKWWFTKTKHSCLDSSMLLEVSRICKEPSSFQNCSSVPSIVLIKAEESSPRALGAFPTSSPRCAFPEDQRGGWPGSAVPEGLRWKRLRMTINNFSSTFLLIITSAMTEGPKFGKG